MSRKKSNVQRPDVALPTTVRSILPSPTQRPYIGPVPWLNESTARASIKCRRPLCSLRAYSVTLPKLTEPDRPDAWSATNNTWHLTTVEQFQTGLPTEYPVATVLHVPADAPATAKFITDADIRPAINQDDSLFNFGSNKGRNITGDFAHSFVLVNDAKHIVYFAKTAVGPNDRPDYYAIEPGQWVLCWPAVRYWASVTSGAARPWNLTLLPTQAHVDDVAASLAETIMYDFLAPTAPLASS